MAQIRHLAFASDHPGKAADFYKSAFGFRELRRWGLDPEKPDVAPPGSGVLMTDGHLNIALLRFSTDQVGFGPDHRGFHHFGVVVDDTQAWTPRLEALGAPNLTGPEDVPPNAHFEIKFRGPDGVVFDISDTVWPGAAPVEPGTTTFPAE